MTAALRDIDFNGHVPATQTHAVLDQLVEGAAAQRHIAAYHFPDSRRVSKRGFPDWVLVGTRGLLWRENKIPPDGLSSEQRAFGYALQALGADWAVWTPADWYSGRIETELEAIA
jgi:hypothetical protein